MAGESTRDGLLSTLRRRLTDERVLAALATVPRECFVPPELIPRAWENEALPIEHAQTISQPLVVGYMCELLGVRPGDRVLDVGTGSGYHAAVLAALGARVWSIERDPRLSELAARRLAAAGVTGVELLVGDGSRGHPPAAPYIAINVAASAAREVPSALEDQLDRGGRLVVPVGETLVVVDRDADGVLHRSPAGSVRFVPLVDGVAAEDPPG
jgi:protein-L-isoaspartate(D-aspartate) O-methyltransferase